VEFTRLLSREFAPALGVDAIFAATLEIGRRDTGQPLHPLRVELRSKRQGTVPRAKTLTSQPAMSSSLLPAGDFCGLGLLA
jgi:hypothetical protein